MASVCRFFIYNRRREGQNGSNFNIWAQKNVETGGFQRFFCVCADVCLPILSRGGGTGR